MSKAILENYPAVMLETETKTRINPEIMGEPESAKLLERYCTKEQGFKT